MFSPHAAFLPTNKAFEAVPEYLKDAALEVGSGWGGGGVQPPAVACDMLGKVMLAGAGPPPDQLQMEMRASCQSSGRSPIPRSARNAPLPLPLPLHSLPPGR